MYRVKINIVVIVALLCIACLFVCFLAYWRKGCFINLESLMKEITVLFPFADWK